MLINNEKEKIMARMVGKGVGTYSVSYGNTYTHTDTYSAMANYNEMPQGGGLVAAEAEEAAARLGEQVLNQGRLIAIVFGRLFSGVHWLTDILGGVLISSALLFIFSAVIGALNKNKGSGSDE